DYYCCSYRSGTTWIF
nr:immunoglobulin light chain junction region [Macaca mulatta]MOW58288.1 immunoglobulin light chain junction region [Macaca mulatta]MOW58644.1 immunoglobulin light chain junction region [Macaca mulatta]MOW59264.1 immunoglobulin light chain junction region [Macaca mulatta]